jgi:hypothetical protein
VDTVLFFDDLLYSLPSLLAKFIKKNLKMVGDEHGLHDQMAEGGRDVQL